MNFPDDSLRKIYELQSIVNPIKSLLGSLQPNLADYVRPTFATDTIYAEMEAARNALGGTKYGYAVTALHERLGQTISDQHAEQLRVALGQSIYSDEIATIREALGSATGNSAVAAIRESLQVKSTYLDEIEKLQKALFRESSHVQQIAALQQGQRNDNAAEYVKKLMQTQTDVAAQLSAQSLQGKFSSTIADLQFESQRPHVIMDAFQRATSWLNPLQDIQHLVSSSALEKYQALAAVSDPLKIYRDTLTAAGRNPFNDFTSETVRGIFDSLSSFASNADFNSFDIDDIDDIDVEPGEIAPYEEIARTQLNDVSLSPESIQALVTSFIGIYQNLPSVRDKKIFITLIYPILIALVFACINPYADFIIKQKLEAANHTTDKSVQQAARDSRVPPHVISSFRFVTSQTLPVRVNGRIKSPIIGTLRFPQPVEILKKEGDWTLIHYSDSENQVELQGWVLSRYLKKFN